MLAFRLKNVNHDAVKAIGFIAPSAPPAVPQPIPMIVHDIDDSDFEKSMDEGTGSILL